MTVERSYKCDLCGDRINLQASPPEGIGIWWQSWPKLLISKPARETEHHLCVPCVSSIQAMPAICGQGFDCTGGPQCGSDHK
jgi:hypothetical protein